MNEKSRPLYYDPQPHRRLSRSRPDSQNTRLAQETPRFQRTRIDRRYPPMSTNNPYERPGKLRRSGSRSSISRDSGFIDGPSSSRGLEMTEHSSHRSTRSRGSRGGSTTGSRRPSMQQSYEDRSRHSEEYIRERRHHRSEGRRG